MFRKALIFSMGALALSGCATAPLTVPVEKSHVVAAPADQVWANLIEYFAANNISIKTIAKDSGIVYAERSSGSIGSMASMASCGSELMYTPQREVLDLNVFVRPTSDVGATNVTVNATFRRVVKSGWDDSLKTVDCNSLGTLEKQILGVAAGT